LFDFQNREVAMTGERLTQIPSTAHRLQQPRRRVFGRVVAIALASVLVSPIAAARADEWIGTWAASPQPVWDADFPIPTGFPRTLWNQTIRQIAAVSIGGKRVRVVLSNEYGTRPLVIGAAHLAVSSKGAAIEQGSDRALTFGGHTSITIPPGAPAISDPVDLTVAPFGSLAVSLFLPEATPTSTMHWEGVQTAYIAAGNKTSDADVKADSTTVSRLFLSEILVDAAPGARAIVTFGDSITDGNGSTVDANHRWPELLSDRMGTNALARFDRDVLAQPHADTVVVMMGINDIGWPGCALAPKDTVPTAEEIIDGYQQLIARAHAHNMRIIGATLTPFADSFKGSPFEGYYTADKDKVRVAVNTWIRSSGAFDGVIDFDQVVKDPSRPTYIQAAYDKGDHLHPQDDGYKAMAESIDLALLTSKK
jgi:lysophospholipase L1-like esterase